MFYGDLIMKKYLINYLRENGKMLKVIATFIIIGIIVGIVIYFIIPSQIKKEMIELIYMLMKNSLWQFIKNLYLLLI